MTDLWHPPPPAPPQEWPPPYAITSADIERPPRSRGVFWSTAITAVLAIGFGCYYAVANYGVADGPSHTVSSYFAALHRGDAARALSFGLLPPGSRAFLTDPILGAQNALGRPSNFAIDRVKPAGDRLATVQFHYSIDFDDGMRVYRDQVDVRRVGNRWLLATSAVSVRLVMNEARDRASIVNVTLPSGTFLVFPGHLPLTLDADTLTLFPDSRVALFKQQGPVVLHVTVSKSGQDEIRQLVAQKVSACLQAPALDCPQPAYRTRVVPGTLKGTTADDIASVVTVRLTDDPDGVIQIGGKITVKGRFRQLSDENIAISRTGTVVLPVSGVCSAKDPGTIVWNGPW